MKKTEVIVAKHFPFVKPENPNVFFMAVEFDPEQIKNAVSFTVEMIEDLYVLEKLAFASGLEVCIRKLD